ncbi:MAG: RluA family pseudouridine synthase [Candidatus Riflebacteria bacterium]|nr:RluA family pseudouridine synthase [Candidatus Riflebacteria bacterium]
MTPTLDIIHRDDMIVVVNKSSGMLSVPGRGPLNQVSVVQYLLQLVPGCINQPSVHRLDMDTSGLMVLALTADGHRHLSNQFQARNVEKTYEALLAGDVKGDEGSIELPFRLDPDRRPHQIYDPVHGKIGVTRWRVLARTPGFTRVEFIPLTGRTHQLRVHAAHPLGLHCPIVDDRLYGSGTLPGKLKLHARRLVFDHPGSGARLAFECTPPF